MLAFVISMLFFAAALPVQAHHGRVAVAYPVQGITIDGDLSDWPRYAIFSRPDGADGSRRNINAVEGKRDFQAFFRAGYNAEERAVYIAVEVQDQSIVANPQAQFMWGTSD